FTNFSAVVANNSVNNIMNGDTAIASLIYENTNVFHTTQIAPGKTLSIFGSSGLLVGSESDLGSPASVSATITGAGGALMISIAAANMIVRQGSTNSGSNLRASLDLSGLDSFQATVARLQIGALGTYPRPSGVLRLAKTNLITASGASPAIIVGGL